MTKKYRLTFCFYSFTFTDDNTFYFDSIEECKEYFDTCLEEIKEFDRKYKLDNASKIVGEITDTEADSLNDVIYNFYKEWKKIED